MPASATRSGIDVWWNPSRAKQRRAASRMAARFAARRVSVIRGTWRNLRERRFALTGARASGRVVSERTFAYRGVILIIVTGATGKLGSLVVEQLLARVPAAQVGVSVRDPAKAAHLAERGVRVRRGDFTAAGSLATAFEGASQILLVSAGTTGEAAM